MKKFDAFLENIGLKNTATGEKKTLGKIIGAIVIIALVICAMIISNKLFDSITNSDNKKGDIVFDLKGNTTMVLYLGQEYHEPGYDAFNEYGNDISNKVEIIGSVDEKTPGIYDLSYRLNLNGKIYLRTRTITVVDNAEAIFMLLGESEVNLKKGEEYKEDGYFLILPGEGDPDKYVTISGNVNENVPGIYRISYKLDHSLLKHELIRTINVVGESSLLPTITLVGNQSQTLKNGENYVEKGYSAYDSVDGDITKNVVVTNNVKNGVSGLYEIKYSVKNSRGFESSISRIIKVLGKNENTDVVTSYGGIDDYIEISSSNKAITKDNIILDISVISSSVKSIILPDNTITTSKNLKYTIKENGTYIIIVELNNGVLINGSVIIDNIDRTGPTGSCQAVYRNGKVSFAVNASDSDAPIEVAYDESLDYSKCSSSQAPDYCFNSTNSLTNASSGIDGYSYYNGEVYSDFIDKNTYSNFTSEKSGYKVILKDKIGNTTQIDCTSKVLSTITGIKIVGETKAKLGDEISLQVVFIPEDATNRSVTWEVIEGSDFGNVDKNGVVKITDDGRYLLNTDNYIIIRATSLESGLMATHKINIYLDEKRLDESGASVSGGGSAWKGGTSAGLANPNGIAMLIGENVDMDVSAWKGKNVTLVSSDPSIVSVSGYKINALKMGNVTITVYDGNNELKVYNVAVIQPACGKSAQYMTQTYQIGEQNAAGVIVYGMARSIAQKGTITIGKNQILKVNLKLTQGCGETEYLTRTSADGESGWRDYFRAYSDPFVNRYDKTTFIANKTEYNWIITPRSTTNDKYIQLSQTSTQATTVYSEIKSFARVNVKVVEENVDIGRKTSVVVYPKFNKFNYILE